MGTRTFRVSKSNFSGAYYTWGRIIIRELRNVNSWSFSRCIWALKVSHNQHSDENNKCISEYNRSAAAGSVITCQVTKTMRAGGNMCGRSVVRHL